MPKVNTQKPDTFVQPPPVDPIDANNLPADAQVLYDTVRNNGARIYHYKGYYTYIIKDSFVDDLGETWVTYFNADNCGTKFQEYDGSFMRQFSDPNFNKDDLVKESFYKQNALHVASFSRLCERNKEGKLKYTTVPPQPTEFSIKHITTVMSNSSESEKTFKHLIS